MTFFCNGCNDWKNVCYASRFVGRDSLWVYCNRGHGKNKSYSKFLVSDLVEIKPRIYLNLNIEQRFISKK